MDQTTPETPPVPATEPAPPTATPAPAFGSRELLLAAIALLGGGLITYALLMGRAVPTTHAAPASGTVETSAPPRPNAAPKPQQWSAARRELWLGERRKGVAYDVSSNEPVGAWMKNVRPILVVRCTGGTTEMFVVTETAAQIEPQSDAHTVAVRFDDGPPVSERWPDSTEHDALFAPDGGAFTARVKAARTLHFRFTPHNAPAVTATFNVEGLAPLLAPATKHCGS